MRSKVSIPTEFASTLADLVPRLRRFAYGLCGSMDDAEDIVQDACERALTREHQWQAGTRLDSWMFRIVQTTFLNRTRHASVRQRHAEKAQVDPEPSVDGPSEQEAFISLERVRQAVGRLPENQRAVLMLVGVEGYSYKETAESLGLPIGTVTSRLARARQALVDDVGKPTIH